MGREAEASEAAARVVAARKLSEEDQKMHEMTDEQRLQLMNLVKSGELTIEEARMQILTGNKTTVASGGARASVDSGAGAAVPSRTSSVSGGSPAKPPRPVRPVMVCWW